MSLMWIFREKGRLTWQVGFTDHRGIQDRKLSLRTRDRSTALTIANKIERMIDLRKRGDALSPDLLQWMAVNHRDMRAKLVEWEIIPAIAAEAGRRLYNPPRPVPLPPGWTDPPAALVDAWELELTGREVTEAYAIQSAQRVRVLLGFEAAGHPPIYTLADVTADGIMARIRELRRLGPPGTKFRTKRKAALPRTCQRYLEKAQEFFGWLVAKGWAQNNPIKGMTAYSDQVIEAAKERRRRALTMEEQSRLVTGTIDLAARWNMLGSERSLLYRTVLRTGLRAYEARTLTVASFNFWAKTITVLARDAKASREDVLPIAEELIPLLKEHFIGKLPTAPAFTPLSEFSYCEMLRQDMEELGIAFKDALGRYADFHALRHTYGTELARVTLPASHQRLMRHKSISTTMRFYTHLDQADNAAAVAKLPGLGATKSTGAEGAA